MKKVSIIIAILFCCAILVSGCIKNKAQHGAAIGGLGGAAIGSQFGPSKNRQENALIGAGIGMVLGYLVGNEYDKYDQQKIGHVLEHGQSNCQSTWTNPDTRKQYVATPKPVYKKNKTIYRDIEIESKIDGKQEIVHATAYRKNGKWHLVQ